MVYVKPGHKESVELLFCHSNGTTYESTLDLGADLCGKALYLAIMERSKFEEALVDFLLQHQMKEREAAAALFVAQRYGRLRTRMGPFHGFFKRIVAVQIWVEQEVQLTESRVLHVLLAVILAFCLCLTGGWR